MSILELGPVIFGGTEGIIAFMKSKCIIEEYKIVTYVRRYMPLPHSLTFLFVLITDC